MTETDVTPTWEQYASTWSALDAGERRRRFETCLAPDCVYTDPNVRTVGYDELASYMEGFQAQLPRGGFATRAINAHHDNLLVHWDMVDGDGTTVGVGSSFATVGADGRLSSMTGFFDTP
jgi:hypothetical protein